MNNRNFLSRGRCKWNNVFMLSYIVVCKFDNFKILQSWTSFARNSSEIHEHANNRMIQHCVKELLQSIHMSINEFIYEFILYQRWIPFMNANSLLYDTHSVSSIGHRRLIGIFIITLIIIEVLRIIFCHGTKSQKLMKIYSNTCSKCYPRTVSFCPLNFNALK